MAAQYWSRIRPPSNVAGWAVDSGYSTSGPKVRMHWTPGYVGGSQYRSEIDEGASPGRLVQTAEAGSDGALVTTIDYVGATNSFWVRHTADPSPAMWFNLTRPASEYASRRDVFVPWPLGATITGPDNIGESGSYTWDANPERGPGTDYHFQWYSQVQGYPIQKLANSDGRYLTQTITVQSESLWLFRLIVTLWDTAGTNKYWADSASMMLIVVGLDGPFGHLVDASPVREPTTIRGVVDVDGTCRVVPDDRSARQALLWRLWNAPTPIAGCDITVTLPPRPKQ